MNVLGYTISENVVYLWIGQRCLLPARIPEEVTACLDDATRATAGTGR